MTLRINIEINLASDEQPTTREQAILDSMAAHPASGTAPVKPTPAQEAAVTKVVEAAAPKAAAPAAEVPAKRPVGRPKLEKPAPAPASAQSNTPAVLDTTLDEEEEVLEEAEEDFMGEGEEEAETTSYTKADAIAAATKLVSAQKQAVVKAALATVGAKRVSDVNDDADIQAFMAALEG